MWTEHSFLLKGMKNDPITMEVWHVLKRLNTLLRMILGSTPCLGTHAEEVKAHAQKKDLYMNNHTPSSVKAKNNSRIETSPNSSAGEQINKQHFSATVRNESLIRETTWMNLG